MRLRDANAVLELLGEEVVQPVGGNDTLTYRYRYVSVPMLIVIPSPPLFFQVG